MRNSFSSDKNKNLAEVLFSFNGREQYAQPVRLTWQNEVYWLGGVQFWYAEHKAGVLVHHYRVGDENGEYTFDLSLETENLTWSLDQVVKASLASSGYKLQFVGA